MVRRGGGGGGSVEVVAGTMVAAQVRHLLWHISAHLDILRVFLSQRYPHYYLLRYQYICDLLLTKQLIFPQKPAALVEGRPSPCCFDFK